MYLLDTDIASLHRTGNALVAARVLAHPMDQLAVSVITVEEMLGGWFALLRRVRTQQQTAVAYRDLASTVEFLSRFSIVTYTEADIARFEQLRARKLNVGAMDLRIAAIALENGAILVTRNTRDFARVPDLALEDWTQ